MGLLEAGVSVFESRGSPGGRTQGCSPCRPPWVALLTDQCHRRPPRVGCHSALLPSHPAPRLLNLHPEVVRGPC